MKQIMSCLQDVVHTILLRKARAKGECLLTSQGDEERSQRWLVHSHPPTTKTKGQRSPKQGALLGR